MFKKVLIANRGEIALRIIRACKELGLQTVAVYSEADAEALHVRFADEAVCIGPGPSHQSYLNIPRIIAAAEVTNAEAIHPGYGFLAESAHFAEICEACEITFIGPAPDMISKMGDKAYAKKTMREAGVPVIPGSKGVVHDPKEARQIAEEIGFPVILKAAAGGGGRGMRVVPNPDEIEQAFLTASNEAKAAFGNPDLYLERYFDRPRHVEIQILADSHGNVVALGERECSIQRKHQKLVEESPSPAVDANLRRRMEQAAVLAAKTVNYRSAGTIEFLLDQNGDFYFMEMNTRIQVEHPVTEMVTGADLVKQQILVAAGEKLDETSLNHTLSGHAIECRINAEDPEHGFRPSPGRIESLHFPGGPGIRVDSHVYAQYVIPPFYDSLIAKVIAHGRTRDEAIRRMQRALEEFVIEGVKTTIPLHERILGSKAFQAGDLDTSFLARLEETSAGDSEQS